ncbi:MAG: SHOCT domain-containing protein [Desulfitobacteriaceae bacterium]
MIGILIFLVGLYFVWDYKNNGKHSSCCKRDDKALDIIKERYARSEITTDEFNTMKDTLAK